MKILLVDDHPLFRDGLKYVLRGLDKSVEMDEAGDCAGALARLGEGAYDLVLLDLKLPSGKKSNGGASLSEESTGLLTGLSEDLIRIVRQYAGLIGLIRLREASPGTPVIILSGVEDPQVVHAAIELGAMGFIPKSSTTELMIQAMRLVLAHGVYLPPAALDAVPPDVSAGLPGLTPRQMDVMRCLISGKPNKVIARELDVSEATVKAHLTAVFQALGAKNRTEAVYAAAKLGLRIA